MSYVIVIRPAGTYGEMSNVLSRLLLAPAACLLFTHTDRLGIRFVMEFIATVIVRNV